MKDGLKLDLEKIRVVKESSLLELKEVVRSFFGMIGYLLKFILRYVFLIVFLWELIYKDIKFKWGVKENEVFEKLKVSIISESIMVYFNLVRLIVVRVEVSFYEGLLVGLF